MNDNEHVWALVLAAGDGTRLSALTRTSSGAHVPKQFCSLLNGPSLVNEALRRARGIAAPERVCIVVAAKHRRWWKSLAGPLPAQNVIVQPQNRGTANGILLPLLHIVERDPSARVVLLPSDHHVQNEPALARALCSAVAQLRLRPDRILLLGLTPDEPDTELGYIVPGARNRHGGVEVAKFVEKPTAAHARELIDSGALWNAFIIAATGQTLLHLIERRFPEIVTEMRNVVRRDRQRASDAHTAGLYRCLPTLDFSSDVLGDGTGANLQVLEVAPCGWSDLGTSKRVAKTLRQLPIPEYPVDAPSRLGTRISLAARLESLRRADNILEGAR